MFVILYSYGPYTYLSHPTLVHTGPLITMVHAGPHWSTLVHTGPLWSGPVWSGPLWSGPLISRSQPSQLPVPWSPGPLVPWSPFLNDLSHHSFRSPGPLFSTISAITVAGPLVPWSPGPLVPWSPFLNDLSHHSFRSPGPLFSTISAITVSGPLVPWSTLVWSGPLWSTNIKIMQTVDVAMV